MWHGRTTRSQQKRCGARCNGWRRLILVKVPVDARQRTVVPWSRRSMSLSPARCELEWFKIHIVDAGAPRAPGARLPFELQLQRGVSTDTAVLCAWRVWVPAVRITACHSTIRHRSILARSGVANESGISMNNSRGPELVGFIESFLWAFGTALDHRPRRHFWPAY